MSEGFLANVISDVRLTTDEPSVNAKYTDADILKLIGRCYSKIFSDLTRILKYPPTVSYDITLGSNVANQTFVLPTHIENVLCIEQLSTDNYREGLVQPRNNLSLSGPLVRIEGNILYVDKTALKDAARLRVHYVPSATALLHGGTCEVDGDGTTITLGDTPTVGTLDTHAQAYAGHIFRIFGDYTQERPIVSYDNENLELTLAAPLNPIPTTGGGGEGQPEAEEVAYEIVPLLHSDIEQLVTLAVARRIVTIEGNSEKLNTITQSYREDMRDLLLKYGRIDKWLATIGGSDTVFNNRFRERYSFNR